MFKHENTNSSQTAEISLIYMEGWMYLGGCTAFSLLSGDGAGAEEKLFTFVCISLAEVELALKEETLCNYSCNHPSAAEDQLSRVTLAR